MSVRTLQANSTIPKTKFIPPLENGDRLTRSEFERRYEAMPNVKAELIQGVVYMSSPVRIDHAEPSSAVTFAFGYYSIATEGTRFAENATVRLNDDTEPQPDVLLWVDETFGGNSFVTTDRYLEGAPEFLVEIALSTVSNDLHDKKDSYEKNGVLEYLVWRVLDREIDWFVLENEKYVALTQDENGIIESPFFKGLRINIKALLENDLQQVLKDLQIGINSNAHQEFVEILNSKRKK